MVAITGFAACGDDPPREPDSPVTASVNTLQKAFEDGDAAGVCALITRSAHRQAGNMAEGDPTKACARDVTRAFLIIQNGGGWGNHDKPTVEDIRVEGDTAWVLLDHEDDWRARVPFVREGGRWKLAGFFGVRPADLKRAERVALHRPFPAAGRPVEASTADGAPCPAISDTDWPKATGGCQLKVASPKAPIEFLTPFGDFKFGDCTVDFRVLVDAAGRTWTRDWEVEAHVRNGCSDINTCVTPAEIPQRQPWRGRIRSDGAGGFIHHMQLCLRTCVGSFMGDFAMRLVRVGDRWKAEPVNVGATGFRFGESLPVPRSDLDLEAAGA